MSKMIIIASSFTAGFLCSAVLFAVGQASLQRPTQVGSPNVRAPETPYSMPHVPPLLGITVSNSVFDNGPQFLDGLNCEDCEFKDASLYYGGGSFQLKNIKVSGATRLTLVGAAANTEALLNFFHGLEDGEVPPASKPGLPIKRTTVAKKPMTKLDFSPPFIGER